MDRVTNKPLPHPSKHTNSECFTTMILWWHSVRSSVEGQLMFILCVWRAQVF